MLSKVKSRLKRLTGTYRREALNHKVASVLSSANQGSTRLSEDNFDSLQSRFEPRPEYGYEPLSVYRRASERALEILKLPGMSQPDLRGLDLGAGDGMLSVLLQVFGHRMMLTDMEDWRVDAAKQLEFTKADCCDRLPMAAASFDFVISYNSFEHFPDPSRAFNEVLRVLRPGGLMQFQFNPLYCSPWGLHAYRMLRMPYPQFLFSEAFIQRKLDEIGIWDLGKKRTELQALNHWKPSQFAGLWTRMDVEVISCNWHRDESHLNLVVEFPEAFQGRCLSANDLVTSGVAVTLRKR